MTNASVKNLLFGLAVVAIAVALSLGAFATTASAADDGWSDFGGSWSDYGGYDGWSDYGGYDSYSDYGGYDSWSDYGGYNDYETYSNDYELYNNDYELYNNDYETYNNDYELYNNDYETYANDYETYDNEYYDEYEEIYEEYFQEQYQQQYQQQSFAQQQYQQAMQYVPPQYRPQTPSFPVYPQTPHYPTPVPPRPQPPVPQPPVPHYPQPLPPVYNTNTNTNINTCVGMNNCNTNIDNSINGSFNTAVVTTPTPQPIIQYQYPTYIPTYTQSQAPYCVITISQGANGTVFLTWSSQYATSAYITPSVGQVAPNGSTSLYAYGNSVYSLTVYGPGGTYVCRTQAFVNPVGPTSPYVSLTQIPYTGLALGPIGNAIYWMSLISLAVAGAYLLVYYKGGVLALAGSMKFRSEESDVDAAESTIVEAPQTEQHAADLSHLPTQSPSRDAIRMTRDANGQPRLVISRA